MKPTIGRIVLYVLTAAQAEAINKNRAAFRNAGSDPKAEKLPAGVQTHAGNYCYEGEIYPAIVVRLWDAEHPSVNLKIFLDGDDTFWVTSCYESEVPAPGTWHWPPRVETPVPVIKEPVTIPFESGTAVPGESPGTETGTGETPSDSNAGDDSNSADENQGEPQQESTEGSSEPTSEKSEEEKQKEDFGF